MAASESPAAGNSALFTTEAARLIGRATRIEIVGLLVGILAGIGAANALDFSVPGIALGVAVSISCEMAVRLINWRLTRPLAHLAIGYARRYDRVWRAARLHVDTIALVGAPLILLAGFDVPTWIIATGMVIAVLCSFLLEYLLRRHLRRRTDRDAELEKAHAP